MAELMKMFMLGHTHSKCSHKSHLLPQPQLGYGYLWLYFITHSYVKQQKSFKAITKALESAISDTMLYAISHTWRFDS